MDEWTDGQPGPCITPCLRQVRQKCVLTKSLWIFSIIYFLIFFIKVLSYSSNKNHNKNFIEYEYEEIHLFMILYLDLSKVLILLNTLLVVVVSILVFYSPCGLAEHIHSCIHPAPKSILNTLFFAQVGINMQPK